jgi:GntR family transcriptional regulator / MocR family aminotransferase
MRGPQTSSMVRLIRLEPEASQPIYRQLYSALRLAILEGRIPQGAKLPSSRELSQELRVSRNTVLSVYDQLLSEGYLESRTGSGTYVSRELPENVMKPRSVQVASTREASAPVLSKRASLFEYGAMNCRGHDGPLQPFRTGTPALREFPHRLWASLMQRHLKSPTIALLGYNDAAGYGPLRKAIAQYLKLSRGVRCNWEQVVIVGGAQQGLDLAARLLLDSGDAVWMEDPGYPGARYAFIASGAKLVPVPVDEDGLVVSEGRKRCEKARLAYITPSHQYPLGYTMSLARRLEILEWAREQSAWIIEDDYDGEFRYRTRPFASLQGLAGDEHVIYLGTFSKVMFPAMRLAYLVVPQRVAERFIIAKALSDRYEPMIEQMALAEFIEEGHFGRHLRRMRRLYEERQEAMVAAGKKYLGDALVLHAHDAGMHLTGFLHDDLDEAKVRAAFRANGVISGPLQPLAMQAELPPGLMLGYAPLSERAIVAAVCKMSAALDELRLVARSS